MDGVLKTYNFKAFEALSAFTERIDMFFDGKQSDILEVMVLLEPSLCTFLKMNNFEDELQSINANSASLPTFRDRFFRWFNAFRVIKYLNFAHEEHFDKSEITEASLKLAQKLNFQLTTSEPAGLLRFYRELEKGGFGIISQ